jgi:hypothetical protein
MESRKSAKWWMRPWREDKGEKEKGKYKETLTCGTYMKEGE